ncbi:unnamed protein product [Cladocopium goreaui]|uniref:AB hydrolase-1 domain-containing protein n=1 Tax=Cladocopium goreaui TaxID=2562237 RepID=A0A9P1DNG3_9DINO|nr:unnamed protein product [Cladocopium goreaui]
MRSLKLWRPKAASRSFAVLSHSWTGGQRPTEASQKVCKALEKALEKVMMHGILGSKSNWNTPSRQLLKTIGPQGWRILQLDHRAHGRSPTGSSPHNLESCAEDVLETLVHAGVPDSAELVVCGHSFGGKVALAVLETLRKQGRPPRKTWTFDSVPGCPAAIPAEDERRQQSVGFVLEVVKAIAGKRFDERSELVSSLQDHGLSQPLAEWIAQSVRSTADGVELSYDIEIVGELYQAYLAKDMWHLFDSSSEIGVIVAGKNRHAWGTKNLQQLQRRHEEGHVEMVTLKSAGHNVHVDDLPGLLKAIQPSFS